MWEGAPVTFNTHQMYGQVGRLVLTRTDGRRDAMDRPTSGPMTDRLRSFSARSGLLCPAPTGPVAAVDARFVDYSRSSLGERSFPSSRHVVETLFSGIGCCGHSGSGIQD